jgi:hypothetical protein
MSFELKTLVSEVIMRPFWSFRIFSRLFLGNKTSDLGAIFMVLRLV